MSKTRHFLASSLFFALLPPFILHAASSSVQYVGGTVTAIPANSAGTLNLDDSRELRFVYGTSVYRLPYEQITGTDVTKGETHHILRKIPVPSLNPGKRKETLTVNYKDPAGTAGRLNFQIAASDASDIRDQIAIQKSAPSQILVSSQSNEWWGDKYWKTTRNAPTWDQTNAAPAR